MTKSITLGTIICLLTVLLTLSFKSADNEKKDYVTIHFDSTEKDIAFSYSDGNYKSIKREKTEQRTDQTQFLKLINEQEKLGYKLVGCTFGSYPTGAPTAIALLSK
jgi:hypothetical protein